MAPTGNESIVPDPQIVGNEFVNRYYPLLYNNPSQAYRFYQDSSVLGRPGPDRQMKSAKNVKEINDLILAFDMRSYKVEISFADAQSSYENGVVVLVIGSLIGTDNVRRNFTQSFFLAPQNGGFYVLNDVFRFVDEDDEAAKVDEGKATDVNDDSSPELSLDPSLDPVAEPIPEQRVRSVNQTTSSSADSTEIEEELGQSLENGKTSVPENKVADVNHLADTTYQKDSHQVTKAAAASIQLDASKKSYASVIVNGSTKSSSPFVSVIKPQPSSSGPAAQPQPSTPAVKPQSSKPTVAPQASRPTAAPQTSKSTASQLHQAPSPPQVYVPVGKTHASSTSNVSEKNNDLSAKNTSIFVGNLPMNATEELLSASFVNFGPIKRNGIQVRSSKMNGSCYGFVEFESAGAMQSAVKASPIPIGNRQANIEEKLSTGSAGRFSRVGHRDDTNGYRNENLRGRGNFSGGLNNGRNERREPSTGQAWSSVGGQNGDGSGKVYQNVAGTAVARQVPNQN